VHWLAASKARNPPAMVLRLLYVAQAENVQAFERRADGTLEHLFDTPFPDAGNIAAFSLSPDQRVLTLGTQDELISCTIDAATGRLQPVSSCAHAVEDDALAYLSTDKTGRWLFSVFYTGGYAAVHPLQADGTLANGAAPSCLLKLTQGSHCIVADPHNQSVYVPEVAAINHMEGSRIHLFDFDASSGSLHPKANPVVVPPPCAADIRLGPAIDPETRFTEALWDDGKLCGPRNRFNSRCEPGPRHICFHPAAESGSLYASNEQGNSVTHYRAADSTLRDVSTVESVPAAYPGADVDLTATHCSGGCSHLSEIHVHPSGSTLYTSNRGCVVRNTRCPHVP
jgi:6-phosphogluconolactonase